MRSSADFTQTVRRGTRVGSGSVVLHGWRDPDDGQGPLVGFVVSKAVGGAVMRNRVKRRLRHLVRDRLAGVPTDARVVVRALPAAARQPSRLPADLDSTWSRLVRQWQPGSGSGASGSGAGRVR